MTKALVAASLICVTLAWPAAAQATGGSSNPAATGSIDAPKNSTSATTPAQQLPGEAQATTSTDLGASTAAPPPTAKPHRHHPRPKTAIHGPADEPGAPPPHER